METTRQNGSLYVSTDQSVATIEFGHPAGNSFVLELLNRLADAIEEISNTKEITVIILRSEGERTFCAGASLNELATLSTQTEAVSFFSGFARVLNVMRSARSVILGRIQGKAVGGGLGLIAACDYAIATVDAPVRLSELSIGLAPFVIAPALRRKIGIAALSELSLNPTEWKNAFWAKEKGLFAKVYDTIKTMDKELEIHAQILANLNPQALNSWKRTLWQGTDHWDSLLFERAEQTASLAMNKATKVALAKLVN